MIAGGDRSHRDYRFRPGPGAGSVIISSDWGGEGGLLIASWG